MSDALNPDRGEAPKRKRSSPPAATPRVETKRTTKAKPKAKAKKAVRAQTKPLPAVGASQPQPEDEQRLRLIAEEAYLRAERRGFTDGDPVSDWLAAEREVDERLRQM